MNDNLTERELKILRLTAQGFNNKEIGNKLFLSAHTVKVYVSSIIKKLNAKNRTNAVYIAVINNLVN